jgi:hypothetical protein
VADFFYDDSGVRNRHTTRDGRQRSRDGQHSQLLQKPIRVACPFPCRTGRRQAPLRC